MPGHASRAKHTLLLSRMGVCPFSLVRSLLPSSAGVFPKVPLPFSRRLALLLTGLLPSVVVAAPPAITGITPAGVQAGKSVTVSLKGAAGDPAPQVWCSRPGITLAPIEKSKDWTLTAAADCPPGIAWLRFSNDEGASDLRPVFIGTLPEIAEAEPNNTNAQAQKVEMLPVVVNGVLHKGGEVDALAVTLEAGQTLTASIEAHRGLGSPMDGVLQVATPDGFVLLQNDDDRGNDPQLTFTAARPGPYLVRVFAFPADPNSTINYAGGEGYIYRLLLTTGPVIDHTAPLAVASPTPAPLAPVGTGIARDAAPIVPTLIDETAILPAADPSTLLAHRLPLVSHATPVEAAPAEPNALQLLTLPMSLTGHVGAPGEVDRYRFAGKKGESLRLAVEARRFDSPLDPVLRLFGPDGKLVKEQDDEGRKSYDIDFNQSLPADGEYRLEVTDRFRHGGPRFAYLLTAEATAPDFELTVEANRWTLKAGTSLEIPVTIGRRGGFKEEIVLEVEGLPADAEVTVAETKSLAMGDSAKSVKLKIETKRATPLNVPLKIIGKAGERRRVADGPIAGLSDRTTALWLTIVKGS